jgi:hypothetical protein
MLNVFQLMTALLVDWLTITAGPPWPWMVAAPPTTDPPSGPAVAGLALSANKVGIAASRPWRTGPSALIALIDT